MLQNKKRIYPFIFSFIILGLSLINVHAYDPGIASNTIIITTDDGVVEKSIVTKDLSDKEDKPLNSNDLKNDKLENEKDDKKPSQNIEKKDDDIQNTYLGLASLPEDLANSLHNLLNSDYMPIDLMVDGKFLNTNDAFYFNNKIYANLKDIANVFFILDIEENLENHYVTVNYNGNSLVLLLNTNTAIKNGKPIDLKTPIVKVNGNIMLPLDFLAEQFGIQVTLDARYHVANLTSMGRTVNESLLTDRFYTYEELAIFSKLVTRESGGTSYEAQHGVGSVVMNQYRHSYFPSTIKGVIYEKSRRGVPHYTPAHRSNFLNTTPHQSSVKAVKYVLRGENSVGDSIFFNTRPFKGKKIYKEVDGVYFCY